MSTSCLNTEDYNYLINNQDIITTCQEALKACHDSNPTTSTSNTSISPTAVTSHAAREDGKEKRRPAAAAGGGGNAGEQERGRSRKQHCDTNNDGGHDSTVVTEFTDWLTKIEHQLDSVCVCNKDDDPSDGKESMTKTKTARNNNKTATMKKNCLTMTRDLEILKVSQTGLLEPT